MRALAALALLMLPACVGGELRTPQVDPAPLERERAVQLEMAERAIKTEEERTHRALFPITKNAAGLCGERTIFSADFMSRKIGSTNDLAVKQVATRVWGLPEHGTAVTQVFGGGSAERAGLAKGDMLLAINGEDIATGTTDRHLQATWQTGAPLALKVLRGGEEKEIVIRPERHCKTPLGIVRSDTVNAWAKDGAIYVTTGLLGFARTDEELALILGHEMAHLILGHLDKQNRNAFWGALLGGLFGVGTAQAGAQQAMLAHSQDFEREADYLGIILAARAGYDIREAPQVWRRMAALHPAAIHAAQGGSHPSTVERFVALEAAVKEIEAKRAAGLPLVPEAKR
jgi:hypothetical protein